MIKNSNNTARYQILCYPYETAEEGIDLTDCYCIEADTVDDVLEAVAEEKALAAQSGFYLYYEIYEKMSAEGKDIGKIIAEWERRVCIVFDTEKVGYRCSSCNTTWDTPTAYCPHCGAMMNKYQIKKG